VYGSVDHKPANPPVTPFSGGIVQKTPAHPESSPLAGPRSGSLTESLPERTRYRLAIIGGIILVTVSIHYGWVLEPIFGPQHWIHAIHGRLCYIPIVLAASWFGLRGGLGAAAAISLLVLPFIFVNDLGAHNTAGEVTEIVFYFALGGLIGGIVDRERRVRRRQQETELALERSQRQALVGRMASTVAHEIKNPIASIKGAVEIICDKDTPEADRAEFREIAVSEIRRIDGTLRDFLEFGRPREPHLAPMNLSETVAAGLRQIEAPAAHAGVRLVRHIQPDVAIVGDREKIHQVMLNLLLNALEASAPGGAVRVAVESEAGGARLTIADGGHGIPPEAVGRIFDPFFTTKSSGSGLGLAVARQIVESHGGSIAVESTVGAGTTFTLRLPAGEVR